MAETITIPSPSLFLNSQSDPSPAKPSKKTKPRPQPALPKDVPKVADPGAITKRKQSKSRNGCITCKAKRLKCDETKPTCQQCARRSVTCGGYKKDFKWRPFEETNFVAKPSGKPKKASPPPTSAPLTNEPPSELDPSVQNIVCQDAYHNICLSPPQLPAQAFHGFPANAFTDTSGIGLGGVFAIAQPAPFMMMPQSMPPMDAFEPSSVDSSTTMFELETVDTRQSKTTAPSSISSGQSPRLIDLLLPGTDLSAQPEEYLSYRNQYPESFYQPVGYQPAADPMREDDVEHVPRSFNVNPDDEAWVMRLPSPAPSDSSSSSSDSLIVSLFAQPQFSMNAPEMLTRRFDRYTCGILSVKDGPTENPWRTVVWPLARDCPALYHAIHSMTSFHQSKDSPQLRIQGIDHMRSSLHALASQMENMRIDAAISTTLALAFSESWDQHTRTGIDHIKGAKVLLNHALIQHSQSPKCGEELTRLRFLSNVWIYMDVIARLTLVDDDESNDFDLVNGMLELRGGEASLDPLMGCASTLFPIIGQVCNLIRRVRRSSSNGPSVISQAIQLKSQLEEWNPPSFIEDPEDESTTVHDSIRTASAYKYATLLYLHQAVPEIPSPPAGELAKATLCELANVQPKSRAVIVQIYPLMAAGSEVSEQEDRDWVIQRWQLMDQRMKLGIIEKCSQVCREVWRRRARFNTEKSKRDRTSNGSASSVTASLKREFSSRSEELEGPDLEWMDGANKRRALSGLAGVDAPRPSLVQVDGRRRPLPDVELLEQEFTVRGRLHWLGVMKDWGWEILLG